MHFSGALIALDTNVLMGKLPVIKSLCFLIEDINMGLFLPCTVMRELDCLKVKKTQCQSGDSLHRAGKCKRELQNIYRACCHRKRKHKRRLNSVFVPEEQYISAYLG
ncbi:hypothetical protein NERG_01572 [Nematocida ausubeli]|uniref:PIN domain-containing protein n=1 Tax=Nematocida ausubeli (strain ATCC PRA-371 / ERTm2) TaxID=1913371 RepID=H8ZDA1_NEMA1|nr:hypothetical protein NERG_01572 [Nematocida ausubeli]